MVTPTCLWCQRTESSQSNIKHHTQCPRCKSVHYCSPQCQIADWPHHHRTCALLSSSKISDPGIRAYHGGVPSPHLPGPDDLCYLKKTVNPRKEMAILGPYPWDSVYTIIRNDLLAEGAILGFLQLELLMKAAGGRFKGGECVRSVLPTGGDVAIQVISHRNGEVVDCLCKCEGKTGPPLYHVILLYPRMYKEMVYPYAVFGPQEDCHLYGVFLSREAAKKAVEHILMGESHAPFRFFKRNGIFMRVERTGETTRMAYVNVNREPVCGPKVAPIMIDPRLR